MPEMQNLNAAPIHIDPVIDMQRGMEKPPDVRVSFNRCAQVGTSLQRIQMVEECVGELFSRVRMLLARPVEYLFQVG